MEPLTDFTPELILECLNQVEDLKKIKDINLMGKKLGLRRFKKADKVLAREMIVNKLQELRGEMISNLDLDSLPDAPSFEDEEEEEEMEPESKIVISVQEPMEEMMVPTVVEEENPELVDIEKEEKQNTNEMYQIINNMVEKLRNNEKEMKQMNESLEEKTKSQKNENEKLNESFENLFKKYELACSENEKLTSNNLKLKESIRALMGNL
jgi:hypothetical protein